MMTRTLAGMMTLLLTCAVVLAACGGGSSGSQTDSAAQAPAQPVCLVPDVVGQSQEAAESKISGSGLQMVSSSEFDPDVPEGSVISQEPAAGTRLEPCAGDVVIVVSLGPEPSSAAPATEPEEEAEESAEPTPTPTPAPDPYLFRDDFENGVSADWGAIGEGFFAVNGRLTVNSQGFFESRLFGDESWTNYRVRLSGFDRDGHGEFAIRLRVQDAGNYIAFKCSSWNHTKCNWVRVVDGQEEEIPGTSSGSREPDTFDILVTGDTFAYDTGRAQAQFTDPSFPNGGVLLTISWTDKRDGASASLDDFQIIMQ
jgi:hypothetical protein